MRKLLFLFVFLFSLLSVQATHMMGADMSYKCLGNGKYKITAKVYRDCQGVSMGVVEFKAYAGISGGNGCGTVTPSGFARTNIRDVTTRCSSASSPCNPKNTFGTGKGVEEHTFECTVDFNSAPLNSFVNKSTCCEVTFYVHECCRNGAITTGPASNDFYSSCMINICNLKKTVNKCNSSPQLTNEPVGFLCCNIPWYYNNGALDTVDFDSISYKLVRGLNGLPNNSVSYSSPFTFQYPMTPFCIPPTTIKCTPNPSTNPPRGFYFDTANGDIIVTPTKCDEVPIIVIEQTEWRQDSATGTWIVVGRTRRDMQMWVLNDCGYNKPPVINGPFSWIICEGDKICKKIKITDETFTPYQTVPDTVIAKWNGGIPGATFIVVDKTKREKEYEFCWQTKRNQASDVSYSFTVTASDQHCTPPVISIRSFKVKVNPRAEDQRIYTGVDNTVLLGYAGSSLASGKLKCGRFAFSAKPPASFKGTASYQWSLRDSTGKKEFYFTNKKSDTITFNKGGKFVIIHTVNNSFNCPTIYRDTVIIPEPPKVIMATTDTFACMNTTMKILPKVLYGKPNYKYYWTRVVVDTTTKTWKSETHTPGDTLDYLTIPGINRDSTIRIKVKDGDGCVFYDTTTIFVKPLPVVNLGPDKIICTYETNVFDGQNNDTVKYLWNTLDTTRRITVNVKGFYWVKITDKKYSCIKYDTAVLGVNDTVISNAGPNQAICNKDTFTLKANHSPVLLNSTYTWGGLGNSSTYKLKSDITKSIYMFTLKTVITQNGHTCEDMDTMYVRVKPLPKISWNPKSLKPQCYSYGSIWLEPFLVKPHNFGTYDIWNGDVYKKNGNITVGSIPYNGRFLFQTNQIDNSKLQGGSNYSTKVYVRYNDSNGCVNVDSTTQVIYGTPILLLKPKTICQDYGSMSLDSFRIKPVSKAGTFMNWNVVRGPNGIDTSILIDRSKNRFYFGSPSQDQYQGSYTLKLNIKDKITGCSSVDTVDVNIISEPTVVIKTIPNYCVNSGVDIDMFDYITVNGVRPTGGSIYIQDVNGDRTHPKVSTNISSGKFKANTGPGVYNIKYTSSQFGCVRIDSFNVIINDTSDLIVRDTIICASSIPLDVLKLAVSNRGGTIISYPDGRFFNGTTTSTGYASGPYKWMIIGLTPNNCQDTEYAKITIVNLPKLKFVKPIQGCELDTIDLNIDTQYLKGGTFSWLPITTFGPNMGRKYIPTSTDTSLGYVDVRVGWSVSNNVCPNPFDTVRVYIHKYPNIDFTFKNGCEPLNALFVPIEKKGINPSWLSYDWVINGTQSTSKTSVPYLFNTQGKYWVSLSVTNNVGIKKCGMTLTKPIEVYPRPTTVFTTDPFLKTTVALPRFKTINTSSVSQNPFVTNMSYNWSWGKTFKTGSDTSKQPLVYFGKDTGIYWIKLVTTTDRGCKDSSSIKVIIDPDIIVFIPDAFTPDGSGPGDNDIFIPRVLNNKTFSMAIYNRWGEKMYQTNDLNKGWDGMYLGKPAISGVYVYKMFVTSLEDKLFQYNGTFTLIR